MSYHCQLLCILLLFTFTSTSQDVKQENNKIYSVVVRTLDDPKDDFYVLLNKTKINDFGLSWRIDTSNNLNVLTSWHRLFPEPFDSATFRVLLDFERVPHSSKKFPKSFYSTKKVKLIKKSKFDSFFKPMKHPKSVEKGWERFYNKYPGCGGVFQFSDVKYSADMQIAVVYFSIHRNGLNGGGYILVLIRKGKEWEILHTGNLWVS